jgi:hypothetical protein
VASLLHDVLEAHGGSKRWSKVSKVRAHVESGGMLMRLKGKSRQFRRFDVEADTARQRLTITPYPSEGQRGVFDSGTVRIETDEGESLGERDNARDAFFGATGMARQLRWSDRDALYFAGYANWNYLNAPFSFEWPGVETREGEPIPTEDGEGELRCLEVTYPEGFHTHCAEQTYYFDERGLLVRHDYHPEVVATFAHACHMSAKPQTVGKHGGIVFETERRIFPKGPNGPLPRPQIVTLDFSAIELA